MKNIYYSNTSYIKAKTSAIRNERLDFMEGKKLGDLSIRIEDNATVRKVRRIVEKRVSQNYYSKNPDIKRSAKYATRHHMSNILKKIYTARFPKDSGIAVRSRYPRVCKLSKTRAIRQQI